MDVVYDVYDECPVCFDSFKDTRHPIIQLDCGHVFCRECIKRIESDSTTIASIACPYCRQIHYTYKTVVVRKCLQVVHAHRDNLMLCSAICAWIFAMLIFIFVILVIAMYSEPGQRWKHPLRV